MSERKVLSKYYPPDFDPSKIARTPKHLRPTGPKTISVRLMAPFSMKCTSCGEYIYKGRKFNARKETTEEKYHNIAIYRFYIRCTRCSSEITFKTDPMNQDFACERGAKRNFEKWRDPTSAELQETADDRLDRLEREEVEAEEEAERNVMEELEQKREDSQREMEIANALDDIRMRNARIERGEKGSKEEQALLIAREEADKTREQEERELEEAARQAFTRESVAKAREDEYMETGIGQGGQREGSNSTPTFERVVRPRKSTVNPLIKKATSNASVKPMEPVPKAVILPAVPTSLGLGAYDSDDDD